MKTSLKIVRILDTIVSMSLLLVGIYLFFIQQQFVNGAIIIGMHSLYQIPNLLLGLGKLSVK